jgi:hypothetical protein
MLEFCNGCGSSAGMVAGKSGGPRKNEKPGILEKKRVREVVRKQTGAGNAACRRGFAD